MVTDFLSFCFYLVKSHTHLAFYRKGKVVVRKSNDRLIINGIYYEHELIATENSLSASIARRDNAHSNGTFDSLQ